MPALLRGLLRAVSPRHRRWHNLLRSLDLDPGRLPRPVDEPTSEDFIICGTPRSGTSLLTAMLFQPPRCVTVMEPWDGMRLPPAELFRSLRSEVLGTGGLARGKLDLDALRERRVRWWREGNSSSLDVVDRFRLGVKWPAFTRYLGLLPSTRFLVCVRHPHATLASFEGKGGRLVQGLDYEIPFNQHMNETLRAATDDPELRRVLMYEYIVRSIAEHQRDPNVRIIRYEDWFADPGAILAGIGEFLGVDLGKPPVDIRQPRSHPDPDDELRALVRTHCPSAAALGYGL